MPIKFLVLGGGGLIWVLGGECRFYFDGREDFSEGSYPLSLYMHISVSCVGADCWDGLTTAIGLRPP